MTWLVIGSDFSKIRIRIDSNLNCPAKDDSGISLSTPVLELVPIIRQNPYFKSFALRFIE
jgi:hypothetical protein